MASDKGSKNIQQSEKHYWWYQDGFSSLHTVMLSGRKFSRIICCSCSYSSPPEADRSQAPIHVSARWSLDKTQCIQWPHVVHHRWSFYSDQTTCVLLSWDDMIQSLMIILMQVHSCRTDFWYISYIKCNKFTGSWVEQTQHETDILYCTNSYLFHFCHHIWLPLSPGAPTTQHLSN